MSFAVRLRRLAPLCDFERRPRFARASPERRPRVVGVAPERRPSGTRTALSNMEDRLPLRPDAIGVAEKALARMTKLILNLFRAEGEPWLDQLAGAFLEQPPSAVGKLRPMWAKV